MAASSVPDNKWSKNCFGNAVPPSSSSGKFTQQESILVKEAVEEYCAARQISPARLCSECEHKSDMKGAWQEISKCLPHRSVQSVYRHGLRILHPFKRGGWTVDEEAALDALVQRIGKKWVTIQNKLNRSADSCRDKYREMGDGFTKGRWNDDETAELQKLIREHLQADPNATMEELGQLVKERGLALPWMQISKKIGKRSRLSCFKKWQKMTGLISPSELEAKLAGSPKKKTATAPRKSRKTSSRSTAGKSSRESYAKAENTTLSSPPPDNAEEDQAPLQDDDVGVEEDLDAELLQGIIQMGATRASDVPWSKIIRGIDDAQERWNNLLIEWQEREGEEATEDAMMELPLSGLAQLLLDSRESAKVVAETVIEAVDLPDVV